MTKIIGIDSGASLMESPMEERRLETVPKIALVLRGESGYSESMAEDRPYYLTYETLAHARLGQKWSGDSNIIRDTTIDSACVVYKSKVGVTLRVTTEYWVDSPDAMRVKPEVKEKLVSFNF